jgi:hypothetical protein
MEGLIKNSHRHLIRFLEMAVILAMLNEQAFGDSMRATVRRGSLKFLRKVPLWPFIRE